MLTAIGSAKCQIALRCALAAAGPVDCARSRSETSSS